MSADFHCPYCDAPFHVCHDDGHGYDEDTTHHDHCGECGKNFVFTTMISFSFSPAKADCLNDGEHNWRVTHTIPRKYSRMRCNQCDAERNPTDAERDLHNLKDLA